MTTKRTNRRRFIKGAGAAGVVALAGCSGDGGNGNGNGNGNGGNGNGGNGNGNGNGNGGNGNGGQTDQGELTPVSFAYPPWAGLPAFNYITEQTDILETELNEYGYTTGEISRTWDESSLFLGGHADMMPTAGGAEAARMAMERDIELTVHAQAATNYEGWYVREGSDLDPANTGGARETFQTVIDEERPYGHPGMNQGVVWPESVMWYNRHDMQFGPDVDTPLNIRTSEWTTLPGIMLDNEDVDMICNSPALGMTSVLVQDDPGVVDIGWCQTEMEAADLSPRTLNLGGFVSRTEFSENNEGAMMGWMKAWQQGLDWIKNRDNWEEILDEEDNWQHFGANNREEAEYTLTFAYSENPSEEDLLDTDNPLPIILEDFALNEQRITDYTEAINHVQETGALQSGDWESYLSFKPMSI